jgi:serine/threonine protein phosphatase PrpC
MTFKVRSHIATDRGRVRASNQDSGFAGEHLFLVADGMGGHAGGDIASAIVTQQVAKVDRNYDTMADGEAALLETIHAANETLVSTVIEHPELAGLGTTFSGILVQENRLLLAHIGDSRVYRKRGKTIKQMTKDHTFVQKLLDLGRITEEEAAHHPRRSVLMKVLGDVSEKPELDVEILDAKVGDRWLICSDGLSGVVPEIILKNVLLSDETCEGAADLLVREALEYGAPDNVTVVVLDIVAENTTDEIAIQPRFVGSAANEVVLDERKGNRILRLFNPMLPTEFLGRTPANEAFAPATDEYLELILSQTVSKVRNHRIRQLLVVLLITLGFAIGLGSAYSFTQTRYYVGDLNGQVAIYQGIKERLGPFVFSHLVKITKIRTNTLSNYTQQLLQQTIPASSRSDVTRILTQVKESKS